MTSCSTVQSLYPSPLWVLTLIASTAGFRALLWPEDSEDRVQLKGSLSCTGESPHFDEVRRFLDDYFSQESVDPSKYSITWDFQGTPLQIKVWKELANIPFGTTVTYKELAKRIWSPTAIRTVASAVGKNPFSILLPCHRVVGTDGKLHWFAGGIPAKEWLLQRERL